MFHSTNLPLSKWFWAIYLVASDKGGISALRLSRQINVSWITASRMLRKIRIAMGHRDSIYRLHELIEIDDALIGGRHTGESGDEVLKGKHQYWWPLRTVESVLASLPCSRFQESIEKRYRNLSNDILRLINPCAVMLCLH